MHTQLICLRESMTNYFSEANVKGREMVLQHVCPFKETLGMRVHLLGKTGCPYLLQRFCLYLP